MDKKILPWTPPSRGQTIVPVFLPFRGCPERCLFCAQDAQTGQDNLPLEAVLGQAFARLQVRAASGLAAPELAFYGGTFTTMPRDIWRRCLDFAVRAGEQGLIRGFRCSTRPDSVDATVLSCLAAAGCGTVELGVQSFADPALSASRRAYNGATALAACRAVKAAGLNLGVQLLPGLPGSTAADFPADVERAVFRAGADMLRFYPCLVLRGTALEEIWRAGKFSPLPLEICLDLLAVGWLTAARAGIPVIRIGLAPEKSLDSAILAGPVHPALGARVMARALYTAVREAAEGRQLKLLEAPSSCRGYFWGHGGELRQTWAELGLGADSVRFTKSAELALFF